MKTTDELKICPYTGLRSFTEEESLYFKGRDLQVDQLTALLEQNKFLMVTGASGEGKSSLIYAGLIPNARAGFFKAKYSNWVVADFRPERNPVANMAQSLATQFNSNPVTVETELRRGYSSLVDLYINSSFYLGEEENITEEYSPEEIRDRKRKAANLIIIVDQFEEFFTNPENFYNESPSSDSQIVVNLILETARIAIRKNLPVYVVCTMRSDYIGQCSAFRGLPEYIGFSQFFVPRLKRKDLKQVIEEPALLSGNKIAQRLIERLVFDIAEGVDQLPILQHALSRIWMMADQGSEEMDLIHYAMVGGMSVDELPDEDISRFRLWIKSQPEHQQHFYKETGLARIIEIHANLLYENAWDYYSQHHPEKPITQQEAKRIVALSFSCLTKIDNSRAVRNRMSLEEITGIINAPNLTTEVVGEVLNIFREEGNSFIRPFKTSDPATYHLSPDTVLDITHESLIRNWNKLNQWANREFEFYSTFLDFKKQLDRWKKSGKNRGFLLPVGPLSYFENWYKNCKPNAGWIMRYAEAREDAGAARRHAEETLADIRSFIRRSARKEIITRSFMKYGPRRIASLFAVVVMLVLSGFYGYNADQKKNNRVIARVKSESENLLKSREVALPEKAIYLLAAERHDSSSLIPYLQNLGYRDRVSLANEVYKQILSFNKHLESPLKSSVFELLAKNLADSTEAGDPEFLLLQRNKFLIQLLMDQYYAPDSTKKRILNQVAEKNYEGVIQFYSNNQLYHPAVPEDLNMALQIWLTAGLATPDKTAVLLKLISPLSNKEAEAHFNTYYAKGSFEADGRMGLIFNGGYHTLACLYAANGDLDNLFWCFNKVLENNQHDYFELPRILNNHLNVLGYLYQYGHRSAVPAYLEWLNKNTAENPPQTVLRNAILRSGYISHMYFINVGRSYYRSTRGYLHPNLCLNDRAVFDAMEEDYENALQHLKDPSLKQFDLALNLKRKAMFYSKYWFDRGIPADTLRLNGWLNQFVEMYNQMDKTWLEGFESSTMIYNGDGVRTSNIKRNNLLIYPDYRDGWFSWTYHTDYLFNYLFQHNLLNSFFKTGEDLQVLHFWVAKTFELKTDISPQAYSNSYKLPDETLKKLLVFVDGHPQGASFDRNLVYAVLSDHAFNRMDTAHGLKYYRLMDLTNIPASSVKYEYIEKAFLLNTLQHIAVHLAEIDKPAEAAEIAGLFPNDETRMFCYEAIAHGLYTRNASPQTFIFLDSVYATGKRTDFSLLQLPLDCRNGQILVLSEIGSRALNNSAEDVLREIPEEFKFEGIISRVTGIAGEGNYYRALTSIPKTLTESQDLYCRTMILLEDCRTRERLQNNNRWNAFDENLNWSRNYINFTGN